MMNFWNALLTQGLAVLAAVALAVLAVLAVLAAFPAPRLAKKKAPRRFCRCGA